MDKENKVVFASIKLKSKFETLKEGKFEDKQLYQYIIGAKEVLKQNPKAGDKIPHKLWPKIYKQKYNITNLWRYELPGAWRLVYTIKMDEITILNVILEWFTHKEYDRRFHY